MAVVQMGLLSQGLVDTAMVGRVDAVELAAVTLGNLYFFGVSCFGMGLLLALDPIVSQAFGAGDRDGIRAAVQRGLLLSVILAAATIAPLALADPVFALLRQPPEVAPLAAAYCRALIAGMWPYFGFIVFRQVLQAVGKVAPVVLTIVLANLVNVAANWVLVFGNLGAPAMGAVGSGWATSVSRWFMCGCGLLLGLRELAPHLRRRHPEALSLAPLRRMVAVGAPIGLHLFLEFGAFGAIGILMGWIGAEAMAGHQVAIGLAAFAFMIPLGISQAAAVLVGRAVGEGRPGRARRSAGAAVALCCMCMAVTTAVFLTLPAPLAGLFTPQAEVLAVAAALIPVAGVFQLVDGLQVVCAGALRGVADTLRPMIYNVMGFWLIGFPVSLWLGFERGAGPVGLWWGLAAGLGAVAAMLLARVRSRFRGPLGRLVVDGPPR